MRSIQTHMLEDPENVFIEVLYLNESAASAGSHLRWAHPVVERHCGVLYRSDIAAHILSS